ncbi:LysR substrate-binding domain-containing protein [Burkholderia glumae]|uniref:LysR substrate-binding domain-containing protein n=1 Tax=Burkholderia glumae TaxID=337 RepID=UPI002150AB45|nr:LysR substrate-binding domain-containing protein [Burkholderia glumae]UVT00111.1 LysR family transcriptional regulator [Burkholderia glumae]
MRIQPLPPLQCLVSFDAAARLGNFTRAAEELNVTQGAVSKQVVKLEQFLGTQLFVRDANALRLTIAGQEYALRIHNLLTECADVTASAMKHAHRSGITVACASGTAMLFMSRQVAEFSAAHPEIPIRVIVREAVFELSPSEFDVAFYYVRNALPAGMTGNLLIAEEVGAYCAPTYLEGRTLSAGELATKTLLVADEQQRQWMGWHDWFKLTGAEISTPASTVTANSYPLLLDLAVQGKGIILGWNRMITPLVEQERLVRASSATATYGGAYYTLWPAERRPTRSAMTFIEWLTDDLSRH